MEGIHSSDQQNGDIGLQEVIDDVMEDLVDDIILGVCFEVHRANKLGTLFLPDTDPMSQKEHEIVDKFGVDVFGQVPTKKQFECVCPHCNRNLAASRFAPHLEKCMGMGRNSSRIASRRQARIAKELERLPGDEKNDSDDHQSPDDDNDVDWSYNADKRLKKLKKEKQMSSSPRRNKFHKLRNGDASSERSNTPEPHIAPYELMSTEERKQLLIQTCGVISEHTKRMCTRSHRCPQHTDEQRKQVRSFLLGHGGLEDDLIDIDTLDDSEHQSLRESLAWDANSTESSPVDTALGNTTTSRKRHFGKSNSFSSKSKKKKSGKHAGSHSQSQHSNSSSTSSTMYEFD